MAQYSTEQLRNIFRNKFDQEAWKSIVVDIFGAGKVRREKELFTDPGDNEVGYYLGSIETPDSFRIGLFYYKINSGSVAHKKVGLRNLVKRFVNQNWGEFDAAIVVFDDNQDWRLSFVCDIKEEATAPNVLLSFSEKRIISIERPLNALTSCRSRNQHLRTSEKRSQLMP